MDSGHKSLVVMEGRYALQLDRSALLYSAKYPLCGSIPVEEDTQETGASKREIGIRIGWMILKKTGQDRSKNLVMTRLTSIVIQRVRTVSEHQWYCIVVVCFIEI